MPKPVLFICCITLFAGCTTQNPQKINAETAIINEAFLSIVDTVAYRYHNLRPAPGDRQYMLSDTVTVGIKPQLTSIRNWAGI